MIDSIVEHEKKAAFDYGEYGDVGFEGTTSEDYSIPFLAVLQDLSLAVKDETVENAKAGMIINGATNKLYDGDEGVRAVPCFRQRKFIEWQPRSSGGGYVSEHRPEDAVVKLAKEQSTEFGSYKSGVNDLVETYIVYWIIVDAENEQVGPVVTSFKSASIKKYKNFMTVANQIRIDDKSAPLFAHVYRLKTVKEQKPGGDFYNWDIRLDGLDAVSCRIDPASQLFQSAVALHRLGVDGNAKVELANDAGLLKESGTSGDDVPF